MRLVGKLALVSALATATFSMAAAPAYAKEKKENKKDDKAPKLNNSKGFVQAYLAVDALIKAGDIVGAKTASEAAVSAIENDDDRLVAGQMILNIADKSEPKDMAFSLRGYDLLLGSTSLAATDRAPIAFNAGRVAYGLKEYSKAIGYFEIARANGVQTADLFILEGHSRLSVDDTSGFDTMRNAVAAKKAGGELPPEQWLRLAAGAAERLKNNTELLYWTSVWVENYPTSENWRLALGLYSERTQLTQDTMVDLYRLRRLTGSLVSEADYYDYVDSMSVNGLVLLPREVLDAIQEGVDSGVLRPDATFVKEARADANAALADDSANSAAREKKAVASNNPRSLLSAADVALNMGNYARANELYDMAIAAGADANIANMRKGIALYKSGDSNAAKAAFEAVTASPNAAIAGYWLLLITTKSAAGQ